MYFNGSDVKQDYHKALYYFKKVAKTTADNNEDISDYLFTIRASYLIGKLISEGFGNESDYHPSYWLNKIIESTIDIPVLDSARELLKKLTRHQ